MLLQQQKQRTAVTTSVPAPLGGWNARDSLANMQPMDAVQMVNFFPTPTDVTLRKGWTKKSDGITGEVETIVTYPLFNGGYELFAFADTRIWDATTSTASIALTGLSNARWQHVNFSNDSGNYIIACNGVDTTMVYDGTRWFFLATTETPQTISSITHVTTTATVTTAAPHGLITGNSGLNITTGSVTLPTGSITGPYIADSSISYTKLIGNIPQSYI